MIAPDVGGGFGAKIGMLPRGDPPGWLAKQVGRPVRWVETRTENMMNLGHGRGQVQHVEIGGTADGKVTAYRLDGARRTAAPTRASGGVLPFMTRTMLTGVYAIPKAEFNSRVGRHQHHADRRLPRRRPPRGHGRHRAGHRPVRRRDRPGPGRGAPPQPDRQGRVPVHHAGRHDLRHRRLRAGPRPRARGRRLRRAAGRAAAPAGERRPPSSSASASPSTSRSPPGPARPPSSAPSRSTPTARSSSAPARRPTDRATTPPSRCSSPTASASTIDDIEVVHGDTDVVPRGQGTMGSRSLQAGGVAVARAADAGRREGQADRRRPARGQPRRRRARPGVGELPRRRHAGGGEVVDRGRGRRRSCGTGLLAAEVDYQGTGPTFPFGAHLAVVEVDTRDRQGRRSCASSPSTTPAASSTRCWPRARSTAASPRASPRRCSRRSATTPTATRSRRTSPTTRSSRAAELPELRAHPDGDADADERARRQGHRRVGHDRLDAGGAQRRPRRARAASA